MNAASVVTAINGLCGQEDLDFESRCRALVEAVGSCSRAEILDQLDGAGVIPEQFAHDSTEEKLFAKYCDALLACAFTFLGMTAEVITERGDSADVVGSIAGFAVVGDAKAFRLSRTAKNQKDFKVEALNNWRKGAEYACLAAPQYHYPTTTSQIYSQATRYNVTLFSYTHLAFLIRHKPNPPDALEALWRAPGELEESKSAVKYWRRIDEVVLAVTGATAIDWKRAMAEMRERLPGQAAAEIAYWTSEKKRVGELSRDEAVRDLITTMKIDSKIEMILKNSGSK